jgi:hypothetical protein
MLPRQSRGVTTVQFITADAERCESAEAAIERAESLSRSQGYIGAWAFSAVGDQTYGFAVDEVLSRFGSFPDYRV